MFGRKSSFSFSQRPHLALLALLALFVAPVAGQAETLVGTLGGEVSVDNRGSASYSIPIHTPPGRNGIEPSVSINYSSQGGNGIIGMGFSLSTGFPQAITRGRTILARDGFIDGPDYDSNDKYYLDGKRLIVVSGTYGAPESEYRTEVDSFSKIVATGTGSNIDAFTVTTTDGLILTFGKFDEDGDSAIEAAELDGYQVGVFDFTPETAGDGSDDTVAFAYALKRVQDLQGNYANFEYAHSVKTGEYVLSYIDYTGNSSTSAEPFARVQLEYDLNSVGSGVTRNDQQSRHVRSRRFDSSKRLDRISIRFDASSLTSSSTKVSYFDLGYEYGPNRGLTRLTSVAPSFLKPGSSTYDSLAPTTFDWSDNSLAHQGYQSWTLPADAGGRGNTVFGFGDFNGDGKTDYISGESGLKVYLSNGSGFAPAAEWMSNAQCSLVPWSSIKFSTGVAYARTNNNTNLIEKLYVCDINGDGLSDVIFADTFFNNLYAVLSNGGDFTGLSGSTSAATKIQSLESLLADPPSLGTHELRTMEQDALGSRVTVSDFTGDGRADILVHGYDGTLRVSSFNGNAYPAIASNTWKSGLNSSSVFQFIDRWTNRDIKKEINYNYSVRPIPCELNGDGLTDYVWEERVRSYQAGQFVVQYFAVLNNGNNTFSNLTTVTPEVRALRSGGDYLEFEEMFRALIPGDYNGDGLTDFLKYSKGPSGVSELRWKLVVSRGESQGGGAPSFTEIGFPDERGPAAIPEFVTIDGQSVRTSYSNYKRSAANNIWSFWGLNLGIPLDRSHPGSDFYAAAEASSSSGMTSADINRDGLDDLIWYGEGFGWCVIYATGSGTGFGDAMKLPSNFAPVGQQLVDGYFNYSCVNPSQIGDINGDGLPDWTFATTGSSAVGQITHFAFSSGEAGDRVTAITNGLGHETEIDYAPITDPLVYTKGSGTLYPVQDTIDSRQVVWKVSKDTGAVSGSTHLKNDFLYTYAGARTDLSGRGFLGYQAFATLDYNTRLLSYQFTTQSFPMTGLVKREEVYAHADNPSGADYFRYLSQTTNEVTCDEVVDAGNQRLGTLYPMINASRIKKWEVTSIGSSGYDFTASSQAPWIVQAANGAEPTVNLYSDIVAYTWFDGMAQGTLPPATPPAIFVNDEGQSGDQSGGGSGVKGGFRDTGGSLHGSFHLPEKLGTSTFPALIKFGNIAKTETNYGDGNVTQSFTTYKPTADFGTVYLPGKVASSYSVSYTAIGDTSYDVTSPTTVYSYYTSGASLGLLKDEKRDASGTAYDITTTYTYSSEGLPDTTSISGNTGTGRQFVGGPYTISDVETYDPLNIWPLRVKNAYGHWTETQREYTYGQPMRVTNINRSVDSKSVKTTYDAVGRVLEVNDLLLGTKTTTTRGFSASQTVSPPSGSDGLQLSSSYYETVAPDDQPSVTTYYDFLGRRIRTVKNGFASIVGTTDQVYDVLGRVVASSTLYTGAADKFWTINTYDLLGRIKTTAAPNGTVSTNTYHGRVSQLKVDAPLKNGVNPLPQTSTSLVDSRGNTVKVWNADITVTLSSTTAGHYKGIGLPAESLRYELDGAGRMRLTDMKDVAPHVLVTYDAIGNQSTLDDPDKGLWTYEYNGRGELVYQQNAKGDRTEIAYDRLGRKISTKIDDGGNGAFDHFSRWHYYENAAQSTSNAVVGGSGAWIGSLQRSEIDNYSSSFVSADHATSVSYTDQGQPRLNLHYVDGKYYYIYTDYDAEQRPFRRNYFWRPAGLENDYATQPQLWQKFGVQYHYDAESYVTKVSDSQNRTWWEADATAGYDAYDSPVKFRKGGNAFVGWTNRAYDPTDRALTAIKTGNSGGTGSYIQNWTYNWDGLGNLVSRQSSLQNGGSAETFSYDDLNRLTHRNGSQIAWYDNIGNITSKKDVTGAGSGTYAYSASKPHAVASAWGYTMGYDANGNMVTRSANGETWGFNWTAFDKPNHIVSGQDASLFKYDAENQRVVHVKYDSSSGSPLSPLHAKSKKVYVGSQMEVDFDNKVTSSSGQDWEMAKVRIYIDGPDGRTGAYEFSPNATSTSQVQMGYIYHQDHLGTVDVITDYVNGSAAPAAYAHDEGGKDSLFSYDPWGERRDPTDWLGKPSATSGSHGDAVLTPRGFTDHEMLDDLGLVHMNGRIYDPLLGRFLSADVVVQAPHNLQSYNRYSYVFNNPLSKVDPSGYTSRDSIKERRLVYTTNLGFIDMQHARGNASLSKAWKTLQSAKEGDVARVTISQTSGTANPVHMTFDITAKGSTEGRAGQLLYAWQRQSEKFEKGQDSIPQRIGTFLKGLFEDDKKYSSGSTEDLVSNTVAFYATVENKSAMEVLEENAISTDLDQTVDEKAPSGQHGFSSETVSDTLKIWDSGFQVEPFTAEWTPTLADEATLRKALGDEKFEALKEKYGDKLFENTLDKYKPDSEGVEIVPPPPPEINKDILRHH